MLYNAAHGIGCIMSGAGGEASYVREIPVQQMRARPERRARKLIAEA